MLKQQVLLPTEPYHSSWCHSQAGRYLEVCGKKRRRYFKSCDVLPVGNWTLSTLKSLRKASVAPSLIGIHSPVTLVCRSGVGRGIAGVSGLTGGPQVLGDRGVMEVSFTKV